ncbi:YidB family protein [Aestuariivirga litoralis]|uniref:YidB family protein n=1 Tax=Aestuariivirga litoralis TaxID=2650924 RepID=UPI0018C67678|nr:YidB family protein [Aestuariivirga litoralis]MBG1231019.1 DUF937 domain-containing protein [Aestuariivirga litoralis]
MANNNMPSLAALLGLVAVAGYQNRDKISDFVKNMSGGGSVADALPGGLGSALGSAASSVAVPGGIAGALGGLLNHMKDKGAGDVAGSWVGTGSNLPITGDQLSNVLGPDLVSKIAASTGLSPDQIVGQLSQVLPQVVDHLTPHGKVPNA